MARLPKCPVCENVVNKEVEEAVKHSSKTYHRQCFIKFETRKKHREELLAFICDLHHIDVPSIMILKQIKDFEETYKFSLKGMEMTLRYFHHIKNNPVDAKGIGIIPWVYDDASKFYRDMDRIRKHASSVEFNNTEEVVYVRPSPKKKRKDYIDIEGILND